LRVAIDSFTIKLKINQIRLKTITMIKIKKFDPYVNAAAHIGIK
jgi:hypothetical protein